MIVSDGEAAGAVFGEAGETVAHALTDRFKNLKAGGTPRGMDTDTLGGTVVDRDEHRGLTLASDRRRQVCAPHRVHPTGVIVLS